MTQQLEALKQALEALETGGLLRKMPLNIPLKSVIIK